MINKNKKLNILIIIPPFLKLPTKGHGGTERIAEGMIKELLRRKHRVTLIGCGDCQTKARFIKIFPQPISEQQFKNVEASRPLRLETAYIAKVTKYLLDHDNEFDVVFNHLRGGYLLLPFQKYLKTPIISVLHLPLFKELVEVLADYPITNFITVSNNQRKIAQGKVNFLATVHNGVDINEFLFNALPRDYFLFIGAIGEHKAPHLAIQAAKKAGVKLILAGGKKREPYFSKKIKLCLDGKQIRYIGEVAGKKRIDLFKNAKALLFPIQIQEAFGLVMIEAMACGTPVIAFDQGAVREIITDGKDGFIVKNYQEMAIAIKKINLIERSQCRKKVESKFTWQKMTDDYLAAFLKNSQGKK